MTYLVTMSIGDCMYRKNIYKKYMYIQISINQATGMS